MNGVKVRVSGRNHARFLDALHKEDVAVERFVRLSADEFTFTVQKKDLHKTFAILDTMCYTYSTDGKTAGKRRFFGLLRRAGLIGGLAVFSLLAAFSRHFIWRVEIVGNDAVPDKVIEKVLEAQNIAVGKKLSGFDSGAVSAAVRAIDGIKMVSAERKGTTVRVEVFESEPSAPPLSYSDTDILSEFDATVTRVIAREGTALVHEGQNVFRGTPLIGAHRKGLEEGSQIPSRASGIVYGKVAFTERVVVATEWYEQVLEKTQTRTRLSLFGLTLGKKLPSGADVRITETVQKFDAFLPIAVRRARITHMTTRKMTADIETLAEKAENETVQNFIHGRVTSGFTSRRSVRELGGGLYAVYVFIEAETVIGGA